MRDKRTRVSVNKFLAFCDELVTFCGVLSLSYHLGFSSSWNHTLWDCRVSLSLVIVLLYFLKSNLKSQTLQCNSNNNMMQHSHDIFCPSCPPTHKQKYKNIRTLMRACAKLTLMPNVEGNLSYLTYGWRNYNSS